MKKLTVGEERKVFDYMIKLMQNGTTISTWKLTEKSLILVDGEGRRNIVKLDDVLNDTPVRGTMMVRHQIFPEYTNWYEYTIGETVIYTKRTRNCHGGTPIYRNVIPFDTAEEALKYFQEHCGA